MDFGFIKQVFPLYVHAAILTLKIGILGIILAIAVGLLCTLILHKKIPVLRQLVSIYIELSRNTPLLIQLFFIYYGLPKLGIRIDAFICGVIGLAFLGGSYMCEAFRGGECTQSRTQSQSGAFLYTSSTGNFNKYTCICSKHHILIERDISILGYKLDGLDVHGKGFDRNLLQDSREPGTFGIFLSDYITAGFHTWILCRKEGALCRIWVLMLYSKAKTP